MTSAPQKNIASQTFKILCLTYLRSIFKISKTKNEKLPKSRSFRLFCGFVLVLSKPGLVPWTKITMGGKCLIWAAKHNFSPILWFPWNRHVFHGNVIFPLCFLWSKNENNCKEKFFHEKSIGKKDIPIVNEEWLILM